LLIVVTVVLSVTGHRIHSQEEECLGGEPLHRMICFTRRRFTFAPELYIVTWSRLQPKRKSYFLSVQLRVSLPRYVAIRHVYIPYKLSSRPRESLGVKCGRRSSLNLHSSFVLTDPQPLSASRKPQAESSLLVHERLLVERLHHHLIQSHFT
jgi:hypothetical protein